MSDYVFESPQCFLLTCFCSFAVLFHNAIPFVGFGFLDNAIMIAAVSEVIYTVMKPNVTVITKNKTKKQIL